LELEEQLMEKIVTSLPGAIENVINPMLILGWSVKTLVTTATHVIVLLQKPEEP